MILLRPDLASAEEIKAAGPRSLPIGLRGVTKGLVLSLLRGDAACRVPVCGPHNEIAQIASADVTVPRIG